MSLYHPTNLAKAKEEAAANLRSRVEAFLFVLGLGKLDVTLSMEYAADIVDVMNAGTGGGGGGKVGGVKCNPRN